MHVVVEAGTREGVLPFDDVEVAAPELELVGDQLQDPARRSGEERPEEDIALLPVHPPREDDPRIRLGGRDFDVRVRFIVAEEDVVPRLVRLDEVVLEEDRLELIVRGQEIDSVNLRH